MNVFLKLCMAIGLIVLIFGGGSFLLGFIGLIATAGVGLFVLMLPFIGLIFVIIFLVWLVYKFAVTLFKDEDNKKGGKES